MRPNLASFKAATATKMIVQVGNGLAKSTPTAPARGKAMALPGAMMAFPFEPCIGAKNATRRKRHEAATR
jgi:hypothetical protein